MNPNFLFWVVGLGISGSIAGYRENPTPPMVLSEFLIGAVVGIMCALMMGQLPCDNHKEVK